ncbi:hypothetical protein [Paenibacillus flagellatus]|uniref:Uncharacterized protein n=1 Tax=Paenibacillus flagellatus TaxID=2211139 RepID=A0A2V5KA95_9BACL|nr:hypothetical protein [Paenibacillus flagellatus]PYI56481.1 hypothetical protein DLM86_05780 [Paenibacillus flagellatus]
MAAITIRPDLKTNGGEVTELLLDGRYVGSMTLVYREGGRIAGAVQLERKSLSGERKAAAVRAAHQYVRQLMDALEARDCEVVVTCSEYDHIIASEHQVGVIESFGDDSDYYEPLWAEDDGSRLDDVDPNDRDSIEMSDLDWDDDEYEPFYCELVIVGESRNRVDYHIYDRDQEWLAEATVRIRGADAIGEVEWKYEPSDEEIEAVADLLVSDFDPDDIDSFVFDMKFEGDVMETIELTHEDLVDDEELEAELADSIDDEEEGRDYSIVLVRNDGDTLTYDLYEQSQGGLPIGQATVDISTRELTGFIDFRDPDSSEDREWIGSLLMQELDKEKDYRSLNLTMLVNNEPIDEILFETETVH